MTFTKHKGESIMNKALKDLCDRVQKQISELKLLSNHDVSGYEFDILEEEIAEWERLLSAVNGLPKRTNTTKDINSISMWPTTVGQGPFKPAVYVHGRIFATSPNLSVFTREEEALITAHALVEGILKDILDTFNNPASGYVEVK